MFRQRRIRSVENYEAIEKIMNIASNYTSIIYTRKPYEFKAKCAELRKATYVQDCERYVYVTTMYVKNVITKDNIVDYIPTMDKYACSWKFDKSGANDCFVEPDKVARMSNSIYKPYEEVNVDYSIFDKIGLSDKIQQSAKPILGYNPKFDNTEHEVYVYDLNSAYANILKDKIIDTYHWREYDTVGEGEVGFLFDDNLTMKRTGQYADRIYKLIESPFKDYVTKYYNIKRNAPSGSRARTEAKAMLNYLVGCWQNHNPFLRAYVVNSCNEFIFNIIQENRDIVCMYNTDAVYSVAPLDLDIGTEIGQFKLEYHGLFRQKGNNYQEVEINKTSYRGVSHEAFKNGFNILTDEIPSYEFPYVFDKKINRIIKNPKYKGE